MCPHTLNKWRYLVLYFIVVKLRRIRHKGRQSRRHTHYRSHSAQHIFGHLGYEAIPTYKSRGLSSSLFLIPSPSVLSCASPTTACSTLSRSPTAPVSKQTLSINRLSVNFKKINSGHDFSCEKPCTAFPVKMKVFPTCYLRVSQLNKGNKMSDVLRVINVKPQ